MNGKGITVAPGDVHKTLEKSMLVDGFPFVLDLEKSHGSWMYDSVTDTEYLDFVITTPR